MNTGLQIINILHT